MAAIADTSRPGEMPGGSGHRPVRLRLASVYRLAVGLAGLTALGWVLAEAKAPLPWAAIAVLAALSLLIQRASFHLGTARLHSLCGVFDLTAVLALGRPGAVVAAASGLGYLVAHAVRHRRLTRRDLAEVPLFDAGLKAFLGLGADWLFVTIAGGPAATTGPLPAEALLSGRALVAVAVVGVAWFVVDRAGWAIGDALEGEPGWVGRFVREAYPMSLLTELLPLPLSLLLASALALWVWAFVLLALAIIGAGVLAQRWNDNRRQLTERVEELSTVEQVGRAIAQAQLDVDALCHLLYQHVSRVADTTIFHLGLFVGDDYVIRLWMREGQQEPERAFRLSPGVGLVNWMRDSHQPLLVRDFEKELDRLPARPAYVAERPPRSALFVPLMAGDTVIGTLSIQSYRRDAYGQSEQRLLSAIGNQAAVAIQKAQLYDQERKRARQLETIGQVSRKVSATLQLEELFQQTVRLIRENFGYYHVAVFAADRERKKLTLQASASAGTRDVAHEVEWGEGLIGWAAANAQPAIANDVEQDSRYLCVQALDETRSELVVPLLLEDELVGVLDVESDQVNAFGADDQFILETLADQVAVAIQKARLYEAGQQQAWVATALLQVAETLGRLSDLDDVLTTIVRLTPMLSGVERCGILLWSEEREEFLPAQAHGLTAEQRAQFEAIAFAAGDVPALDLMREETLGAGQGGQAAPVLVRAGDDAPAVPLWLLEAFDVQEMVLLPLVAQGEFLGSLVADLRWTSRSDRQAREGWQGWEGRVGDQMLMLLSGIANQAAMVIQSARLLNAQREEAYVSTALLQVAEVVSRSGDLADALAAITRITPLLIGVEASAIFLWDAAQSAFVPVQQYGLPRATLPAFWNLRFGPDDPVAQSLRAGRPYLTIDEAPELAAAAAALAAGTPLMLPVAMRGELVGMMSVDCSGPVDRFARRGVGILTGIAGQVAIAVENNRLLQEAAVQERMRHELEVARRIQASFLPERCPDVPGWELAAVWHSAREVAGDFYDFVPVPGGRGEGEGIGAMGVVIADVADKGVPAALFMALSRTLMRTMAMSRRSPAAAVEQANALILADARAELFVTLFYAVLEPDSGRVRYANAGHLPPLLVRAGDARGAPVKELRTGDIAMAVLPDARYTEHEVSLGPGDALVLYTDGAVEALNTEGQMLGRQRLKELVQAHQGLSATELVRTLDEAVAAFAGDAPQFDDITLVVAKRVASPGEPETHAAT